MRTLLVVLAVSGVGCGGLDPQFAGVWNGSAIITVGAETAAPATNSTPTAQAVIEETAGAFYLVTCGTQAARLRLEGGGHSATWSGIQTCNAPNPNCATATVAWRSATATLSAGPTLATRLSGTGTTCGYSASVVVEFSGTK